MGEEVFGREDAEEGERDRLFSGGVFFLELEIKPEQEKVKDLKPRKKSAEGKQSIRYESFNFIFIFSTCSHGIWHLLLSVHELGDWSLWIGDFIFASLHIML